MRLKKKKHNTLYKLQKHNKSAKTLKKYIN